jgi:chromosome segregation ATPase
MLTLVCASAVQAGLMYRYINDQGNVVLDYRVPASDISKGYEILNEEGVVLQVIPRTLTDEERANVSTTEQLLADAKAERERLQAWDESLLLRYSSLEDIEAARDRALGSLLINLSVLKSNTRSLKSQVENYQTQAAGIERAGMEVDVVRLAAIEDLQGEISAIERSIIDRNQEMGDVRGEYQLDLDRFKQLLGVVEMRRNMTAN